MTVTHPPPDKSESDDSDLATFLSHFEQNGWAILPQALDPALTVEYTETVLLPFLS